MSDQLRSFEFEFRGDGEAQAIRGYAIEKNGVLWLQANGETWTVETGTRANRRSSKGAAGAVSSSEIAAPMPGKIIKIATPPGTKVAKGDVIIVMEAMKMEYTLKAPASGTIGEIRCAAGDQVPLGQLLARLKPDGVNA